ncbi:hypothetical protein ACIRYZ_25510 [Kitasatospora sp. NPDC101155]|uniref:hypothetical protein n=1 Tax=Kitasatospora sp. NPDC101155 TaxID=3364097 RepID=UPI003810A806
MVDLWVGLRAHETPAADRETAVQQLRDVPPGFLAQYVRVGSLTAALDLPEPAIGREAAELVRGRLRAAAATGADLRREVLFARWPAATGEHPSWPWPTSPQVFHRYAIRAAIPPGWTHGVTPLTYPE